jgi:hypothetical protein
MVESEIEKVPISTGNIWDEYDPITEGKEELGSGMCSKVTKARKKGVVAGSPEDEIYFIKQIHKEMAWTADNEKPGLELAGNYKGVVKCYKIFDDREEKGEEGSCFFVLQLIDGGYIEGHL